MNLQSRKILFYKLMLGIALVFSSPASSSDQEDLNTSSAQGLKSEDSFSSAPPTQWSRIFKVTDDPQAREGNQVLHNASNKYRPYTENQYAQEFVDQYGKNAKVLDTDADVLRYASDHAPREGEIVELGTGGAKTTQFLSALNPKKKIHTFDSYKGLPEDWDKGPGSRVLPKGTFALQDPDKGYLPPVNNNVYIYVGEFKDTLPHFRDQILKGIPIALLNVDCEIYRSTKTAFDILENHIVPGTVIHLDEGYNYPNYREGEWKAFQEFIQNTGYNFEVIAFNEVHEQVVIRILSRE